LSDLEIHHLSVQELAQSYRKGLLSPLNVVQYLLDRIKKLNPGLHAFQEICAERALCEARAAEDRFAAGNDPGPLCGIPYAVKDLYDVGGMATTAGTRLLEENIAEEDSRAVSKLTSAGMVLLGKTFTVQFAFGGVGINHDQGTPHNPWKQEHYVPGGSSSGSAVAVASGMVPIALGTDTGGSVRIPAAHCGIAGLKTTIGSVSRTGIYPLSWALDTPGPLTRDINDAHLVYAALQGRDLLDPATMGVGVVEKNIKGVLKKDVQGLKAAFCETLFFDDVEEESIAAVREAGNVLKSLGMDVSRMEIPEVQHIFSYGRRELMVAAEGYAVNERLLEKHFSELDPVVAHRLKNGLLLSAKDYLLVSREWERQRASIVNTLKDVDVLLVPTTQIPARPVAEIDTDMETYSAYNQKCLRNTSIGNMLNLCAVTVPCGMDSRGMPMGLMIYGKPFAEEMVLRVAKAYTETTGCLRQYPDLNWVNSL